MLNNTPIVTKNILILNIFVYIIMMVSISMGNDKLPFYLSAHYFNTPTFEPYQVVSHMFTHSTSDIFHIFFNMFALVTFGSHLERIWGPKRFFIFYFATGIGALVLYNTIGSINVYQIQQALVADGYDINKVNEYLMGSGTIKNLPILSANSQELFNEYSAMVFSSMAGASGAVFGLLAAFAVLFPNTQLMLLFPPIPIRAKYLIGGYLAYTVYKVFSIPTDNVAHLAHLGGAIVGIAMVLYWRKTDRHNFY